MEITTASNLVASKVRQRMEARGVSQLALSEATGIPRVTLIRRLNAHSSFTVAELAAIATHLDTTVSALVEDAA